MSFISELFGLDIETPELTETEKMLMEVSTEQYLRAIQEGEALTPHVLASMGLAQGDDGALRNMTSDEFYNSLDAVGQQEYDTISDNFARIEASRTGEKSEFLKQQDDDILEQVSENRARMGGNITGGNLASATGRTTADIQTLEAQQRVSALRGDEERRANEISLQAANQNALGLFRNNQLNTVTQRSAFPNRDQATLTGILNAQQPYQGIRGLQTQTDAANAGSHASLLGLGTALGYGILT